MNKSKANKAIVRVCEVNATDRADLVNSIDISLIMGGARVRAGRYRVTMERIGAIESPTEAQARHERERTE